MPIDGCKSLIIPPGKIPLDYVLWSREISGRTFAKQMGVPDSTVSRWRRGLRPTTEQQIAIAEALGLTLTDLGWGQEAIGV